jgi:signal transduction histidine kinase/DNA-binding response OmpR family regulator/HAMP domain-containing protein
VPIKGDGLAVPEKGSARGKRKPAAKKVSSPTSRKRATQDATETLSATDLSGLIAALRRFEAGDFSVRLEADGTGQVTEAARRFNAILDTQESVAAELARVSKVIGREGKMTERVELRTARGGWADQIDAVNTTIDDLVRPMADIALVIDAVATGDLTQKMALTIDGQPAKGEFQRLAKTVNAMVDQLSAFAAEVTRVAREVGTEGKLGGQAKVKGVSGTWNDLTENVNFMADNLTKQVRGIAKVVSAVVDGDLDKKFTIEAKGEVAELADTINSMVDQLAAFAAEVTRVAREVGTEGILGGQAKVKGVSGTWNDLTENVNFMADNLTKQVRGIAKVMSAVVDGDLDQKFTIEAKGEVAELADTINSMTAQLSAFAAEVTRVAREVGTEGILGGQAKVKGVSGTWNDLTESVNQMADNLTQQVRGVAKVMSAVVAGDLDQKFTIAAKGEVAELADTINSMVDQLAAFASEVTRVAREVGTEGKLGGQANVKGVSGTWNDLTENVNVMAGSLTTQVRAIADVSSAVTQGDLTRSIDVEAAGEVAELKDKVNQMIVNLKETTELNAEQDWLNTNLARFSTLLQGQRDLKAVAQLIMNQLTPLVSAQHGVFFISELQTEKQSEKQSEITTAAAEHSSEEEMFSMLASYGHEDRKGITNRFRVGQSLVGQAALEGKPIVVTEVPPDYVRISSGLGGMAPLNIIVLPILFEEQVMAVIEMGSFNRFTAIQRTFLDQLAETFGVVLNTILTNMRTDALLEQSQTLAEALQSQSEELQAQQEELQQSNEELEEKAGALAEQNVNVEVKNREIESARRALEDKAEQLTLSSKYKSEFLANMSHELRTPLNSLLILAKLLADNVEQNLSAQQTEYALTIYNAGNDLLLLINDILDLSKVEAGKMDLLAHEVLLVDVLEQCRRGFGPLAAEKGLELAVAVAPDAPQQFVTDEKRLQQVLKNLLSNAIKFTEQGSTRLLIGRADSEKRFFSDTLNTTSGVISFAVSDTGIGIPEDKLRLIFEAFQQADGTTSRRYGGTGLGLSISREIARLLGGEIHVESTLGEGSTFTLYLPLEWTPPEGELDNGSLIDIASLRELEAGVALAHGRLGAEAATTAVATPVAQRIYMARPTRAAGDRLLLIVEDDPAFAGLISTTARERGFQTLVASSGEAGLALAFEHMPDAIVLDLRLPGDDGQTVIESLKASPETSHIPVHVISGADAQDVALAAGAFSYLEKPVSSEQLAEVFDGFSAFLEHPVKRLLVVEDDERERAAITALVSQVEDADIQGVGSAEEALELLLGADYDCLILDLTLPQRSGFQLLADIRKHERLATLPVIVYTGKDLSRLEETELRKHANTIIVKDAFSPERLLDETVLFLHLVESKLPALEPDLTEQLLQADSILEGKKVLIVDDDVRNVFALSGALAAQGVIVIYAENGREGINLLQAHADTALVLMDIMMPEMDGYEATAAIRELPVGGDLPIIVLTAKAMKGDREEALAAGASDYITKPVDMDKLLPLMRIWLHDAGDERE